MKKISFNEGTFSFNKNKVTYEVPLEKTNIHSIEEVQFIKNVSFMFPITNMGLSGNKTFFMMEMEVENGFVPLGNFKSNSTDQQKFEFIKQLCGIANELKNLEKLVTVLDDRNILVHVQKQELKFLYCGVYGLMPAEFYNEEDIETQVKRLALFILTSAKYDELRVNGLNAALNKSSRERYKLVSKIYQAVSINEILFLIEELSEVRGNEEERVNPSEKSIFSMLSTIKNDISGKINQLNKFTEKKKVKTVKTTGRKQSERNKETAQEATFVNDDNKVVSIGKSKFQIIVGTTISAILIIFIISLFSNDKDGGAEPANKEITSNQTDEDFLIKGLQYAAIQDYEHAAQYFQQVKEDFGDVSKENQKAILFSYLMIGNYQEAIDIEPRFAYSVINYLVSKDRVDAVKQIHSQEPVILFEKASINLDFKTVLKSKDDIKMDGRRESMVVDAYMGLKQFEEGYKYAKSKGNKDLMIKIREKQIDMIKAAGKKTKEEKRGELNQYKKEIINLSKTSA